MTIIEKIVTAMLVEMKTQGLMITTVNNSPADNYNFVAKAILEAIKEPTEEMKKAGALVSQSHLGADETLGYDGAQDVFETMIEEAIKRE